MINMIGAYVVGIMLLALAFHRPKFSVGEARVANLPNWLHFLLIALLAFYAVDAAFSFTLRIPIISFTNRLISGASFMVHEAGHIYWSWGGATIKSLGGTLNEIIFPIVFLTICLLKNYAFLAALFTYWLGHSLFGISYYAADAIERKLPLVGGGSHDWNIVLSNLNILSLTKAISGTFFAAGCLISILALGLYLYLVINRQKTISSSLQRNRLLGKN